MFVIDHIINGFFPLNSIVSAFIYIVSINKIKRPYGNIDFAMLKCCAMF